MTSQQVQPQEASPRARPRVSRLRWLAGVMLGVVLYLVIASTLTVDGSDWIGRLSGIVAAGLVAGARSLTQWAVVAVLTFATIFAVNVAIFSLLS